MFQDQKDIENRLSALGEHLENLADEPVELMVCGGSALIALGFVQRATKDVDILAYVKKTASGDIEFITAKPLDDQLVAAAGKVARDFNLPDNWINAGPSSAVDFGLPEGIMERVVTKKYGHKLTIHFLGRYDQIHFKLYASVDQGAGKHFDDLLALEPTADELEEAARWSMTHDESEGYRLVLKDLLNHMGYKDVAERL